MHPLPAQLAQYASQHHASQYAQAKFGPRGSPMAYVPLSVQQPAAYAELVARQAAYVYTPWHLAAPTPLLPSPPPTPPPSSYAPAPVRMTRASPNLADDVLSAMSEPLGSAPPQQLPQVQLQELQVPADLKTSATHPLNVSPLIPPELIVTLSLHLSPAPAHAPTIFAVHPAFALDRLSAPPPSPHSVHFAATTQQSSFSHVQPQVQMEMQVQPEPEPASPTAGCAPRPALQLWTSAPLRTALSSALSTSLRKSPSTVAPALPASSSLLFTSTVPEETEEQVQRTAMDMDMSADMSVSTVAELPAPLLPPLALPDVDLLAAVLGARGGRVHGHDRTLSAPVFNVQSISLKAQWDVAMYSRANPIRRPKPALRLPPPTPAPPPVPAAPPMLGNLLLSSCPGKKVRLTGPTRGRAPVSRSLPADLARARALGATLIINCLDDAELSFLGAPWEEYVSEAGKLGISVLRIPVPEGLAPVAVGHDAEGEEKALADFDENLARVLDGWTLRGAAVLVHCRGGVGRAGLIACCWAIRLGLCGPLPPIVPTSPSHTLAASPGRMKRVRMDMTTMRVVEQAIGVVRRRRSLKAVETAEQVSFLVRYVDFLRRRATGPSEALGLAVPA
ncbi:hypothetical protein PENSPDRAFT_658661 [Peniophora sp. CONT]|nr:hypothetical protein PENSPDRAFT_658661 [Peniophora sp. CONT]